MIYRVAIDAWRKSDIEDKIDNIELEKEIHDEIDGIDTNRVKTNKSDIDNFLKS